MVNTQPLNLQELQKYANEASNLLKQLCNENRLMILCSLINTELSVSELNTMIPLSQSALSQHLTSLRRAGLVQTRREAQTIYYSLCGDQATQVITLLHSIYCSELEV
ncbi:MAG: metalloregulator ArsR/SmtB family transcription factor [Planktomarina sp.]|nr:metalloregulator ArsR/SmtB family transcription factor [Planktomarina sp.]